MGSSGKSCSLAILIETGLNSVRKREQQRTSPHAPKPPSIFATSRGPINFISTRARNDLLISCRKSLVSIFSSESELYKKVSRVPSKLYSDDYSNILQALRWR